MLLRSFAMVAPELVARQHYFLEELRTPQALWGIRVGSLLMGIIALVIYFKMKNGKGE